MRNSMATVPRILTSNVVVPSSRVGILASTAKSDGMPVEEIDQYSALVNKDGSFHYENFLDDDELENEERRYRFNFPTRTIKSALISGTTDSFSKAFANLLSSSNASNASKKLENLKTSIANAIGRYEATSRVIKYELAPLGEKMNVSI